MPEEKPRIFAEIEQSAEYYSPLVYQALLSHYDDLRLETDPLSSQLSNSGLENGGFFIFISANIEQSF